MRRVLELGLALAMLCPAPPLRAEGDPFLRRTTTVRVVERCGRPALVVARDGEEAHGSGRSIEAFHLLDALESCAGLFTRFGGHAGRAALSAYPGDKAQDAEFVIPWVNSDPIIT